MSDVGSFMLCSKKGSENPQTNQPRRNSPIEPREWSPLSGKKLLLNICPYLRNKYGRFSHRPRCTKGAREMIRHKEEDNLDRTRILKRKWRRWASHPMAYQKYDSLKSRLQFLSLKPSLGQQNPVSYTYSSGESRALAFSTSFSFRLPEADISRNIAGFSFSW